MANGGDNQNETSQDEAASFSIGQDGASHRVLDEEMRT